MRDITSNDAELLRRAYHQAASACADGDCPGVDQCVLAEHVIAKPLLAVAAETLRWVEERANAADTPGVAWSADGLGDWLSGLRVELEGRDDA